MNEVQAPRGEDALRAPSRSMATRNSEEGAFAPTAQEIERLLFAMESSLQVNKRFQFFLWAQGVLQAFMPHQTLIAAYGNFESGSFECDVFSSDAVSEDRQPELLESARGLVALTVSEWNRGGRMPLLFDTDRQTERSEDPLTEVIWELGLGHIIAHGQQETQGGNGSFFLFGRLPRPAHRRSSDVFELMMPYMHFAVYRYAQSESRRKPSQFELSEREVQIMRGVRDGKTNMEIGTELKISPLTVKNHIQRILRKLNVSNRAQAVAKCLAFRLFAHDDTNSRRQS